MSDAPHPDPVRLATDLLGEPCLGAEPRGIGGNNRLYRVTFAGDRHFALKLYPADGRLRLEREWQALTLLRSYRIRCVPRPVARDPARGCALWQWIEGSPPADPAEPDLDALLAFLRDTHGLRHASGVSGLADASDACLAPHDLARQIHRRRERLASIPDLTGFLDEEWQPAAQREIRAFEAATRADGVAPEAPLAPGLRTPSPADAGFHNALHTPEGCLCFLDFEFFGWDDPVKLTADLLLHPRGAVPPALRARFVEGMRGIHRDDADFVPRLRRSLPLFGLIWCLILLNEFLPEGLRRRQAAASAIADPGQARAGQLAKARALLQRIPNLTREMLHDL